MRTASQFIAIFLFITISSSLIIPRQFESKYPRSIRPEFDSQVRAIHQDEMNDLKPEIVLMGDSTLRESVDFELLSAQMGTQTYGIAIPGSSSALWYLILKNNVVHSMHKPPYLVIFFRDAVLTTPDFRVDGRYFIMVDEFAAPQEDLLVEYSYLRKMNWLERIAAAHLPLYGDRANLRERIDYRLNHFLPIRLMGCGEVCVDEAIVSVFESEVDLDVLEREIDMADSYLWENQNLIFDRQVEKSYLPEIIRMAKENGMQLVLMEVKTLPRPRSSTATLLRKAYFNSLRAYLEEQGVIFYSFADEPRLTKKYYFDAIHLNLEGKAYFTQILAETLQKIIEEKRVP